MSTAMNCPTGQGETQEAESFDQRRASDERRCGQHQAFSPPPHDRRRVILRHTKHEKHEEGVDHHKDAPPKLLFVPPRCQDAVLLALGARAADDGLGTLGEMV